MYRTRFSPVRSIPENSIAVEHPQGLGVAYVYRIGEKYAVKAYGGKRNTPDFHYVYRNLEAAHEKIESWFDGLNAHKQRVSDYRKKTYEPHTFKVGDVVTNSWGYDQTNVDWYKVVRTTDHFVWIQPIAAHVEETGFMSGSSTPHIDTTSTNPAEWGFKDCNGKIERHRAYGDHVCMRYGSGSKWDGREKYASWYA